jgi:lantibiotic modifying enzyme
LLRGEEVDLSALTGEDGQPTTFRVPVWHRVNTDAVSLRLVQGALSPQKNKPWWNGGPVVASAHAGEFMRGLEEMYRYLAGRVPELLAPDGPLTPLFSCHTRVLLDHTRRYLSLLNRSLHPRFLRDDARRFSFLRGELSPYRPTPILEVETKALDMLNVPYFSAHARDVSLSSEGRILIPSYFAAAGEEVVRSRLEGLSEADLENRTSLVGVILALSSLEL